MRPIVAANATAMPNIQGEYRQTLPSTHQHHQTPDQPDALSPTTLLYAKDDGSVGIHATRHGYEFRDARGAVLASAASDARAPMTVGAASWRTADGAALGPKFSLLAQGPNSEDAPFTVDELGDDVFVRGVHSGVIWFVCPTTGETYHSAAKPGTGVAGRTRPGKRWCHICRKCFSANNFSSQHLPNMHRPPPLGAITVSRGADGAVELAWAPVAAAGIRTTSYSLKASPDGGITWLDCMELDEPSATIPGAALRHGYYYRFKAAAVNLAGMGSFSPDAGPVARLDGPPPFGAPAAEEAPDVVGDTVDPSAASVVDSPRYTPSLAGSDDTHATFDGRDADQTDLLDVFTMVLGSPARKPAKSPATKKRRVGGAVKGGATSRTPTAEAAAQPPQGAFKVAAAPSAAAAPSFSHPHATYHPAASQATARPPALRVPDDEGSARANLARDCKLVEGLAELRGCASQLDTAPPFAQSSTFSSTSLFRVAGLPSPSASTLPSPGVSGWLAGAARGLLPSPARGGGAPMAHAATSPSSPAGSGFISSSSSYVSPRRSLMSTADLESIFEDDTAAPAAPKAPLYRRAEPVEVERADKGCTASMPPSPPPSPPPARRPPPPSPTRRARERWRLGLFHRLVKPRREPESMAAAAGGAPEALPTSLAADGHAARLNDGSRHSKTAPPRAVRASRRSRALGAFRSAVVAPAASLLALALSFYALIGRGVGGTWEAPPLPPRRCVWRWQRCGVVAAEGEDCASPCGFLRHGCLDL